MLRKRTLGNKKKSTYTVYSNCNGGSVYFNNNLVGTISSGKLIVELSGADSYTVKIEGGVPSTSTGTSESTDSGSDTSNEYSPSGELRGEGLYYGYPDTGGYSQFMNSNYRANGGNPSGNGLLNGENSTGGPYTGGNGGSGGSVDQLGDEFYAGSDGSDAPGITDNNGVYHQPGTKYGGGKGQGYTTRDFGEPTGKRNAGGGGADRNRDNGNGGESDYDEGCGTGQGTRKSGGYGGGGCGSYGTGGDGTVLIRYYAYKE